MFLKCFLINSLIKISNSLTGENQKVLITELEDVSRVFIWCQRLVMVQPLKQDTYAQMDLKNLSFTTLR